MARIAARATSAPEPAHLTQPVVVRVAATVAELASLASPTSAAATSVRARLEAAIDQAVTHVVEIGEPLASEAAQRTRKAEATEAPAANGSDDPLSTTDAPRRALRAWWRAGSLASVLERMEPAALERLHEAVLGPGDEPAERAVLAELAAIIGRAPAHAPVASESSTSRLTRRLTLAAAAIDALPNVTTAALRAAIDAVLQIDDAVPPSAPNPSSEAAREQAVRGARETGEVEIRSVLPFLMLPSLHHAGWLDTAGTLLAAHDVTDCAFALGAGLAAKVLDPLGRGWSRSAADRAVIAAFTAAEAPLDDAVIARAATRLAPALPALDAALRATLVRARRPEPLVLWRDGNGWLVLDTDGMVVLARGPDVARVLAASAAVTSLLFVPTACADPATLDCIDLANRRFVTDAPPARDEPWRSFAGTTRRLYTNDTATPAPRLAATTVGFENHLSLASELVEVLAGRPALAREAHTALEATCTLAATAALADLGARLFPSEPTTPVLALTRFRDLDARVSFDRDRIRVRVPLGRRHADLMRHGVLRGLSTVPWLGSRVLELGGG